MRNRQLFDLKVPESQSTPVVESDDKCSYCHNPSAIKISKYLQVCLGCYEEWYEKE